MSHLHTLTTEEINAELQRRKAGEVRALRDQIAEHRKAIVDLESKIALHEGTKTVKGTRVRGARIDPVAADNAVLKALDSSVAPLSISAVSQAVGFDGGALKASLARLESAGKIKRTGKARATVYEAV